MTDPHPTPPPDQAARAAIIHERARNVVVVAGAGTGKTNTIIQRAVELLAPTDLGREAIPIQRMVAITFTRRAAGELRFRIREQLLRELEREARNGGERAARLREALGNLDAAFIGTIHGFADRLLRLRPVEATLSPAYALVEDTAELVRETFLRLRRGAEASTLRPALGQFGASVAPDLIDEAAETLRAAARAGLQMERSENAFGPVPSVETTLSHMIETRDVAVALSPIPDPQLETARAAAARFEQMIQRMRGAETGHRQLRRMAYALRRLHAASDPADAFRIVQEAQRGRDLFKGRDFNNDALGWSIYKAVRADMPRTDSLAEQLKGAHRWLATRLVRLFPVVLAMYDRVKAEHEVVDYLDLLIKLRNLLRENLEVRRFYQGLFDHIFVDEFQDTDPLQCEVVFYLCEEGASAQDWSAVRLAPGKLTIVGDPKQSIYRFRRADIVMYAQAAERLRGCGALEQRLETNFRSRPGLITFFNQQLAKVLGRADGPAFDPLSGRANYEDLLPSPNAANSGAAVHVLHYADASDQGLLAPEGRAVEAAMLARYVRWLLQSGRTVRDPDSNVERPVAAGDIAVLACVTTNLPLLLREFDTLGIEYNARGGSLFMGHPVIRQYLLALRAIADRDDGVAEAALLRPPFFAIECGDTVAAQATKDDSDERRARVRAARDLIGGLRARRHTQAPGATARDLIEHTGLGRVVITGRNGQQTLAALYEVAAEVDRRAALDGLDYDAVTELFRSWARVPVFLDTPAPIGASAVHVMTIHGAKGLEFPVVIVWDGFQRFDDRAGGVWQVERTGKAWALNLGTVAVEHPPRGQLLERERQFGKHERQRMYYVAATRARDLLVLPVPLPKGKYELATSTLVAGVDAGQIERFETFRLERTPEWARQSTSTAEPGIIADEELQRMLETQRQTFQGALVAASVPIASPTAVTREAGRSADDEENPLESERVHKSESSRFGRHFGLTVHRAVQLLLSGGGTDVAAAVTIAAHEAALTEHLGEAEADVQRALAALQELGVGGDGSLLVSTEYPLVGMAEGGKLMSGFIDLVCFDQATATVIDFKTDAPKDGALAATYPTYVAQLQLYGTLLRAAAVVGTRQLRLGLLFTATGELRWV